MNRNIIIAIAIQVCITYIDSSAIQSDSIVKIVIHQRSMTWESIAKISPSDVISRDKKPIIIKEKNVLHRFKTLIQGLQIINNQNYISARIVCLIYTFDKKYPDTLSFGYGSTIGYNSTEGNVSWDLFKLVGAFSTPFNQGVIDELFYSMVVNADAYKKSLKRFSRMMDSIRHVQDSLKYYQNQKKE